MQDSCRVAAGHMLQNRTLPKWIPGKQQQAQQTCSVMHAHDVQPTACIVRQLLPTHRVSSTPRHKHNGQHPSQQSTSAQTSCIHAAAFAAPQLHATPSPRNLITLQHGPSAPQIFYSMPHQQRRLQPNPLLVTPPPAGMPKQNNSSCQCICSPCNTTRAVGHFDSRLAMKGAWTGHCSRTTAPSVQLHLVLSPQLSPPP
jgi:hypothetical protein